jgi:hypothetical protein
MHTDHQAASLQPTSQRSIDGVLASKTVENPFTESGDVPSPFAFGASDVDTGETEYRMCASAAPVASEEYETEAASIEVRILWGRNLLSVNHVDAGKGFVIGETEDRRARCDFVVPEGKLGMTRAPLVIGASPSAAVLLPGARGSVTRASGRALSFAEAIAQGIAVPCFDVAGAHMVTLGEGTVVRSELGDLTFEVTGTKRGKRVAGAFTLAALGGGALAYVLGSLVTHAGILAALANFAPPLNHTPDGELTDEQRYMVSQWLDSSAAKETEAKEDEALTPDDKPEDRGGNGLRAKGDEGKMGGEEHTATDGRWAVQGGPETIDPHIARQRMIADASSFGAIGLFNTGEGADPNTPIAPWGGVDAMGLDPMNANGLMWSDDIGNAHGPGGLGLTGLGEGGGGFGEGLGLGPVGTINHGSGNCKGSYCPGFGDGMGNGTARLGRTYRPKTQRLRIGQTTMSGRLPPEVIQRIVRQNFGRFRLCYENGLRTNPNLQGRVVVNFVIGRSGAVQSAAGGGDMPSAVTSCIVSSFYGLSFPPPDGGIVTVSYPIVLTPSN